MAPVVAFALVWVVVSYFPVSNIPVVLPTVRAERFWYFPAIGTAIVLGFAFSRLLRATKNAAWPVVVAFFLSVIPALIFGVVQMAVKRDNELPFGPSLAAGIVLTFLCWRWIGREMQPFFFWGAMLAAVVVLGAVFMLLSSYVIRLSRGTSGGRVEGGG